MRTSSIPRGMLDMAVSYKVLRLEPQDLPPPSLKVGVLPYSPRAANPIPRSPMPTNIPRTHHRVSRMTPEARSIIPGQNPSPIPVWGRSRKAEKGAPWIDAEGLDPLFVGALTASANSDKV